MALRFVFLFGNIVLCNPLFAQSKTPAQRADSLLALMTLKEKVGQLHQISNPFAATGPITPEGDIQEQIRRGEIGSMLNIIGAIRTRQLQAIALQSRLKIPLLFGQDVIHGYRTTFPIPLAEAASWDLYAIEQAARIAAIEASAAGIHWIFAPMVDISRDPRWGRVMEGAGEDTYLGSQIAAARVKGLQGKGLGAHDAVMACVKHFAAYGAAVGGRDYNSVDMSERMLWETYLPPFKAALDAGAATFMNSFNDLNGIPATGSELLQKTILKDKWKFDGFVVSDWGSISDMIDHGYAQDLKQAAAQTILAGNDMDMESRAYKNHLEELVIAGKVPISRVNDAVRRILIKKFELGLFDDPFRFCNEQREKEQYDNNANKNAARTIAANSIVLLKNDSIKGKPVLPLQRNQKIAVIGPLVKSQKDNLGFWSFDFADDSTRIVSLYQGLINKTGQAKNLVYAKGCNLNGTDTSGFEEAVKAALQADVVVMQLGEGRDWSGEAKSKADIHLPAVQEALLKAIHRTGKPIVLLLSAGRPLIFNWAADHVPAILYTWWLGLEAGNAMADVLFSDYNPSGKLPMSFP
jgi:beta-glucosidase